MIFGMILGYLIALLLTAAMSAQDTHSQKVRIIFPEGVDSQKASMTYGRHDRTGGHVYVGLSGDSRPSPFEIAMDRGDRFKALVWAPGCKMKHFDVLVENSDIEMQFACDPLRTVPFYGRVKGGEVGDSAKISVSYMALGTCMWLAGWTPESKRRFGGSCGGPQIVGIATAAVSPDGSFEIELPDLDADPIVSGDLTAELEFRIDGVQGDFILQPKSAEATETKATSIGIAAFYPAEVTFLAVPLKESFKSTQ